MRREPRDEVVLLIGLLAAVFAVRAFRADQPILENFVGRQVPTAMVAGNLRAGSRFLHPELDTGPFPNLFLVEPPVAAQLAASLSIGTDWPLDRCGRIVSAAATTLAAWGLYGLMRRRRGRLAAVAAVVAFASFPVTIRYGRAFQPDCMAMGCLVAALHSWDRPGGLRTTAGALLMAAGLAQKATWTVSVIPPLLVIWDGRSRRLWVLASLCGVFAAAWYVRAGLLLHHSGPGSAASFGNAMNWSCAQPPIPGFTDTGKLLQVGRDLVVRSFTPLGFCLGLGLFASMASVDRLWRYWAAGGLVTLLLLYGKLHHDYYWLLLAPAMAAGVGIVLDVIGARSIRTAVVMLAGLIALGLVQSRSTWRTPAEWRDAPELGAIVSRYVPPDELVIAPEAVIYLGDRRGCRLEWEVDSVRRAASEWRPSPAFAGESPLDLVRFYRRQAGARYVADLDNVSPDSPRGRLHEWLRRDPRVHILEDRPGRFLLAELADGD